MKADLKKMDLAMARACMNLPDIAKASGIPVQSINNLRKGNGVRPATLGKIAKALGVDPADLIKED